jgi:hypothetical protein
MGRALSVAAVVSTAIAIAAPASAETGNIGDVFRDFETICFGYAEHGITVDETLSIENAGFKYAERTQDGSDIFNSDFVQLMVNDKVCAFGIAGLPYAQMLEWTKPWLEKREFVYKSVAKSGSGGPVTRWVNKDLTVELQDDKFADGSSLTALVLIRKIPFATAEK